MIQFGNNRGDGGKDVRAVRLFPILFAVAVVLSPRGLTAAAVHKGRETTFVSTKISLDRGPAMKAGASDLRAMLKRDFSIDLPIAGGFGASTDDPIIITATNQLEASATEMLVLRCIGKGRGVLWRTLARASIGRGSTWREQVKIETKEVNSTEIVTQTENYYFDVAAADRVTKAFHPLQGSLTRRPE
jgi:hypothetical protein